MTSQPSPIWRTALRLFTKNAQLLVVLAIIDVFVELAAGWIGDSYLGFLAVPLAVATSATAAYVIHLSELSGRRFTPADLINGQALPNRAFLAITTVVVAAFLLVGLALLVIATISEESPTDALTLADYMMLAIPVIAVVAYMFFVCRCGTVFPAAAFDGDWNVARALARGRGTAGTLFKELLVGAGLGSVLLIVAKYFLDASEVGYLVWTEASHVNPQGIIGAFLVYLGYSFITALGVVAFCNAYRAAKARPDDRPT